MNCPYCSTNQNKVKMPPVARGHMTVTEDYVGHFHVHAPLGDPQQFKRLLDAAMMRYREMMGAEMRTTVIEAANPPKDGFDDFEAMPFKMVEAKPQPEEREP